MHFPSRPLAKPFAALAVRTRKDRKVREVRRKERKEVSAFNFKLDQYDAPVLSNAQIVRDKGIQVPIPSTFVFAI